MSDVSEEVKLKKYTAEEVHESIKKNKIRNIAHHECGICGVMVNYLVINDEVYFDGGCECATSHLRESSYQKLAEWHNMQPTEVGRKMIAERFGLE